MKASRLLVLLLCSFLSSALSAQDFDLKLQLLPNGTTWGVYVYPKQGLSPTPNTITGSGQITLVAPLYFNVNNLTNVSGLWTNNATIHGPIENPTKSYISFGLVNDLPQIVYSATQPTLLFKFDKGNVCPSTLQLIENGVDPFDQLPNSVNSNPGNELTVYDLGTGGIYYYRQNIGLQAWNCHDCDGDGIPNALEDTNGNGQYDPGIDASDLCGDGGGGCEPITIANMHCAGGGFACGNSPAGPLSLVVDITGGLAPFTVVYSDGTNPYQLTGYESGTPFSVPATHGITYTLLAVTGADGCEATAPTGSVEVNNPSALQITQHPAPVSLCGNGEAMYTACASANNTTYTLSWQMSSDNGATWTPVPMGIVFNQSGGGPYTGSACDTLFVGSSVGLQGYRFRAVASGNGVATAYSQDATLSQQGPLQVAAQPASASACFDGSATFTASVNNLGGGTVGYQWQASTDGGSSWANIADGGNYAGTATNSLTTLNIGGMNGHQFRLRANIGDCASVTSQPATLTVYGPITLLQNPSPQAVCRSGEACFEATASALNGQLSYQWQQRLPGSSAWTDIAGATAPMLCLANVEGLNGACFRAEVKTQLCQPIRSSEACLTVESAAELLAQPVPVLTCVGQSAVLTASAQVPAGYAGSLSQHWQVSTNGGLNWADIAEGLGYQGTETQALVIEDAAAAVGMLFRMRASTGICEAAYSEAVEVSVEGPLSIAGQPQAAMVCAGSPASFGANAVNLGAGDLYLQWQVSQNGQVWTDVAEGGVYEGTQSGTLNVLQTNGLAGLQYRLSASSGVCEAIHSEAAVLAVEAPIAFGQNPQPGEACPDDAVTFSATATGGDGSLALQWQSSLLGSGVWADVAEGGPYSGTQTATLTVSPATGLGNMLFRLRAASQICEATSAPALLTLLDEATCNPTPGFEDCLKLAVKKEDGGVGWSVWAKVDSSFTVRPFQLATSGRVTLVTPNGFAIQAVTSYNGGKWKPGKVFLNPPQDPGKAYFEFNLTPNQNTLELTPGAERLLFTFSVVNGCPASLTMMDTIIPAGFLRNELNGYGGGDGPDVPFHYCGIYGQETWVCPPTGNLVAPDGTNIEQAEGDQEEIEGEEKEGFFGIAPNPVSGMLTVSFGKNAAEQPGTLRLWNLQGQLLLALPTGGAAQRQLDLGSTAPGTYLLTLEVNGKVVQRERVVVF